MNMDISLLSELSKAKREFDTEKAKRMEAQMKASQPKQGSEPMVTSNRGGRRPLKKN